MSFFASRLSALAAASERAVLGLGVRARDLARSDPSAPPDLQHVGLEVHGGVHRVNITLPCRDEGASNRTY